MGNLPRSWSATARRAFNFLLQQNSYKKTASNKFSDIIQSLDDSDPADNAAIQRLYQFLVAGRGATMPLISPISSNNFREGFLSGRDISIMTNSYVSADCEIGDYTYIGFNTSITRTKIGRYCSIGNNVSIGQGEHPTHLVSTSSYFLPDPYITLTAGACEIGHDVWIAADAIVRRGVIIGNGAVIGANSFVNSHVPPFAIYAGSPAKFIRYRLDVKSIALIEQSRWWDKDLDEARSVISELSEICGLI